jgi:hypothetical protein
MSLKNKSTPANRAYWDFIERTARECRDEMPGWAREAAGLPKTITETITRECCQPQDLKPVYGTRRPNDLAFCVHCGHHHKKVSFTDAAGGSDWRWEKVSLGPEQTDGRLRAE